MFRPPGFCRKELRKIWDSQIGPWPENRVGAAVSGWIPAAGLAGGEGPVGEKGEETEVDLWVLAVGAEVDGGGPAMESAPGGGGGRRRCRSGEGTGVWRGRRALLEGVEAVGRVGS